MKGVLKARVKTITDEIKITTAKAIASMIDDSELNDNHILPNIFDEKVVSTIEKAIIETVKKGLK
jgi:malate dehydrogenase (oxaloacetate-decarboxylating)